MQPKAAKKIGGMTPKKMTGGDYGEPEKITLGSDYTITKQIDEQNGKMMICVESEMPGAVKEEDKDGEMDARAITGEGQVEGQVEGQSVETKIDGGKKKRKSSKKRKSMKKKGGMKRKSMKVKA